MKYSYFKPLFSILCLLMVAGTATAEIPQGYYNSINGTSEATLKTALSNIVQKRTPISSYSSTYSRLPDSFRKTDVRPGTNIWWDMYSNLSIATNITFGTYMNREHSFPKSWWGGNTDIPAYVDLNHLYPSEKDANMAKSNYPLGEVSVANQFDNGVCKVGYAVNGQGGGSTYVFEPADEYKGDFARTYFYMVTCYQSLTWSSKNMYMLQQNTYPTLKPWAIDLLLKWHREDPVSDKETSRNDAVYSIQNNRNPFIDYPQLAEYIWGNQVGNRFYLSDTPVTGDPVLIDPQQDTSLDFGQTALGSTSRSMLRLKGENLTGNIEVTIYSGDRTLFSLETSKVAASLVNSEDGYWLPLSYTPTSLGSHTSRLLISGGGITGSIGIKLSGECLPVPTLSTLNALEATDITESSYTANWEAPDEAIDYYIVSRTRYISGSATTEDIVAEDNFLEITDFDSSVSESYNVRSYRLGYESTPSNEIFVTHAGISGVEVDAALAWAPADGGVRIICGATQYNTAVYDLTSRLVTLIPVVENNDIIPLAVGPYLIVTDTCRTPMRVIVK